MDQHSQFHQPSAPAEMLAGLLAKAHGRRTLWADSPANLYVAEIQAEAYLALMGESAYASAVHDPLRDLIANHKAALVAGMPSPVDIVDLGPGYPDKALPLLRFLKARRQLGAYFPVDISARFLEIASKAVTANIGCDVNPLHSMFEDLPTLLPDALPQAGSSSGRLLLLGLTFMNFRPGAILKLLARCTRLSDAALVAANLSAGDAHANVRPYESDAARNFNFLVLSRAGLSETDFDYDVRYANHRVEMSFIAKRSVPVGRLLVAPSTRIVTAISYRYTVPRLRRALALWRGDASIILDESNKVALCRLTKNGGGK